MLRRASALEGFTIRATDGDIGHVVDFYFDDQTWTVRHFVADTGGWLPGREVLISPLSFTGLDWDSSRIGVSLTRSQVENSPPIETDMPISRQREVEYYGHYRIPGYWAGPYRWGAWATPWAYVGHGAPAARVRGAGRRDTGDPRLRSTASVIGYSIEARGGDIGHVDDFLVDDHDWAIRYLVVDSHNWLPGRRVLVAPEWVDRISWSDSAVYVDVTRETIRDSPEYEPARPVERAYESRLYDYYGRPGYWDAERAA